MSTSEHRDRIGSVNRADPFRTGPSGRRPRRSLVIAATAVIPATAMLAGCGFGAGQPALGGLQPLITPKPGVPIVDSREISGLGSILVDGNGDTLYMFPPDNRQLVSCTDACQGSWPPMALSGSDAPQAGPGVDQSLLGSLPDPSGGQVVTYAGWPLYTYAADLEPGQANGQGLNLNGDSWFVVRPTGEVVVPADQQDLR
ncbi:MAG: COG4315 family predicted lipoprotein, partial [Pseudonocardiaceae bacterium]